MVRTWFRRLDSILGLICVTVLSLFRRSAVNSGAVGGFEINRILLIKLVGMGDVVLLQTVFKQIRKAFPQANIHLLTTPNLGNTFTAQSLHVDSVIIEDVGKWKFPPLRLVRLAKKLKRNRYDIAIDFEQHFFMTPLLLYLAHIPQTYGFFYHAIRSKLFTKGIPISPNRHMLFDFLDLAGESLSKRFLIADTLRFEGITDSNRLSVHEWLEQRGILQKPYIIIHPGCGPSGQCRAWPQARFAEIAKRLSSKGFTILISGIPSERSIIESIVRSAGTANIRSVVGELSFYEYAALLDEASLLLSNDTGPMHLGASLQVPTLGLFGPENPARYMPYGKGNAFLYVKQSCSPCNHNYRGVRPKCTNRVFQKCMLEINVDVVERKILEIIKTKMPMY